MRIALIKFNELIHDGRTQRMARSLQREHTVKIFGFAEREMDYPDVVEGIETEIIHLRTRKLSRHPAVQVIKYAEYCWRTCRRVMQWCPDSVLAIDTNVLPVAQLLYQLHDIPMVYCANEYHRGASLLSAYNGILFRILLTLEGPSMRRAFRSFTVNESIARELQHHYHVRRPLLIRNIPDLRHEAQEIDRDRDPLRQAAGLSPETPVILHLGGMSIHRGLHNLVRSVERWRDDIVLVFLGNGPLKPELEQLRDSLGLSNRIVFLNPVPQNRVLSYAVHATAGVVSFENTCRNYYYGLPNKFFQLGLMQIPLLTSAFPEMQTIVEKYNLGATFDPSSPEDMARAVGELIESGFRIDDGDYQRFRRDFSWENEEKTLLDIFSSLEKGLGL